MSFTFTIHYPFRDGGKPIQIYRTKTFPLTKEQLREYLDAQALDAVVSDNVHLFERAWNYFHPGLGEKVTYTGAHAANIDGKWLHYNSWQSKLYNSLPDFNDAGDECVYTRRDIESRLGRL